MLRTEEEGGHRVRLQNRRELRYNLDPPSCLLGENRDPSAGRVSSLGHSSGPGLIISIWKVGGRKPSAAQQPAVAFCSSVPLSPADGEEGGDHHPDLRLRGSWPQASLEACGGGLWGGEKQGWERGWVPLLGRPGNVAMGAKSGPEEAGPAGLSHFVSTVSLHV